MQQTENIADLAVAFIAAQQKFKPAVKDSTNPAFKSKYVDLAGAIEAVQEALNENGLCVIQGATGSPEAATVSVTTRLLHKSGQWIEETMTLPAVGRDGPTAQSFGSGLTYARRYGLMALVGIAPEDDDGTAASGPMPVTMNAPSAAMNEWKIAVQSATTIGEINLLVKVATEKKHPAPMKEILRDRADKLGFRWDDTFKVYADGAEIDDERQLDPTPEPTKPKEAKK